MTSFEMELELAESHDIRLAFGPVSALWRHSRQLVMYLGRVESCCGGFKVVSDVVCVFVSTGVFKQRGRDVTGSCRCGTAWNGESWQGCGGRDTEL